MVTLEVADIQGIILQGYRPLASAVFDVLQIGDVDRVRAWLTALAARLTNAASIPQTTALNVAFTADAIDALGIDRWTQGFGAEFGSGIRARAAFLGDAGSSDPGTWLWGGPGEKLHAALLLYAADEATLGTFATAERALYSGAGLTLLRSLPTVELDGREHFGFLDGMSQPLISHADADAFSVGALKPSRHGEPPLSPGEFVLGYPDQTGSVPTVWIGADKDPGGHLRRGQDGRADFGRNGSFMVLRQLQQDVRAFWDLVGRTSTQLQAAGHAQASREWVAAKLVGRWQRSGTPLAIAPNSDTGAGPSTPFAFDADDPQGFGCPFGAHVRRANPRDWTIPARARSGLAESNLHRILRRGRPYGLPLDAAWDVEKILSADPKNVDRGLHFMCFCASLNRQFEWIHGDWLTNKTFAGLAPNTDPLVGVAPNGYTIESAAGDLRVASSTRLVTVRGGGYFFMPGIDAVRALGQA